MANDDRIIRERLILLDNYLRELHDLQEVNFDTYVSNYLIHRTVERTLHLAVESCIDIGQHIIATEGFRRPSDYQDVFRVLAEESILPLLLLPRLQSMARFRNLIVHDYARIDNEVVFGILKKRLDDFRHFAESILAYLDRP